MKFENGKYILSEKENFWLFRNFDKEDYIEINDYPFEDEKEYCMEIYENMLKGPNDLISVVKAFLSLADYDPEIPESYLTFNLAWSENLYFDSDTESIIAESEILKVYNDFFDTWEHDENLEIPSLEYFIEKAKEDSPGCLFFKVATGYANF